MKRAKSLTALNQSVKPAILVQNLDNIDCVDMTSVSYLRNELRAPDGATVTRG
jgi:hypothetical protein